MDNDADQSALAGLMADAVASYQSGHTASALSRLQSLYQSHPDAAEPARLLGTALCNCGDFVAAAPPLARAVALAPADAIAHAYLAMALLRGSYELELARSHMEQAVALAPNSFVVRWKNGELLLRQGYAREAAEQLRLALRFDAPGQESRAACTELLRFAERSAVGQHNRVAPAFPPPLLRWLWSRLTGWFRSPRQAAQEG